MNKNNFKNVKVALVHDFLTQYGGAEKVLEALCEMFPEAPVYTLLYNKEKMRGKFQEKDIRTSFLQKFPKFLRKKYRYLLPFMPSAPETFDLRDFDLVISSSGAWSKGIVTKLDTVHIAYIHSPMRFIWDYNGKYARSIKKKTGIILKIILNYLRIWDRQAADRPDYLIANSQYTQERIRKYYRRDSKVIYPPCSSRISLNPSLEKGKEKDYFLAVSRLAPYKKVDLVVETFNKLELPLVVIGEGEQLNYLKNIAGKNVKILGWKKEEQLRNYYENARTFVFPCQDDFGITMVEAMSSGKPVIAYRSGGAKEILEEGVTGEFFDAQTVEVLADGVRRFIENENNYNKDVIKEKAQKFSKERFKKEIKEIIRMLIKGDKS